MKISLATGLHIFATRPFSLVITLILAVVVSVISFMLLLFPAIAGYYYAVSKSRPETQFIDLENLFRTNRMLFDGLKRYLVPSYVVGLFGLIPAILLFVAPAIPLLNGSKSNLKWALCLEVLLLPASFLAGSVVLFGFTQLIRTGRGFHSLGYAVKTGKRNLLKVLLLGFLLLFPITGFIIHMLMVFTYPIIVGWAVSGVAES